MFTRQYFARVYFCEKYYEPVEAAAAVVGQLVYYSFGFLKKKRVSVMDLEKMRTGLA